MQTAGHTTDQKADPDNEPSEPLREPAPSGAQAQNLDQNSLQQQQQQQRGGHVCEGARCPCQRYENGELALVVMHRNRNPVNPERVNQNRWNNGGGGGGGGGPVNQNFLNPQYQNPVDLLRNCNRNGRMNDPEENIYERLDDDEDEDDPMAEGARNENPGNAPLDPNIGDNPTYRRIDNHTYERIDNRPWYRSGVNNSRSNNCQPANNLPAANFWNFIEPANPSNHYDHPRYAHGKWRALDSQACLNRLGRLGRNCFSSENIASASNPRRYVYQLGHNRMCQSCARFPFMHRDARYVCQLCNNLHDRLRYYDSVNPGVPLGNSRHYIYQVSRGCRCPFCRGDYQYARFPMNSNRLAEAFRRDCQCRNQSGGCTCRGRIMSSSNSAIYIGRIDRVGLVQSVNNPLYSSPTIYIGRIDRSCAAGLSNGSTSSSANPSCSTESNAVGGPAVAPSIPSTSNAAPPALPAEPSTSTSQRVGGNPSSSSAGSSSVWPISQGIERQHTCDDSCIRTHPGNVTGVCQFLGRSERADCHNGRVSFNWWFVNRWLTPWASQSTERNPPAAAPPPTEQPRVEEPRESQESDTEESRD